MHLVCSYCGATIRKDLPGPGVSHGMCPPCGDHFDRLWAGISLGEYLNDLQVPVAVVDGDGRLLARNARAAALGAGEESDPGTSAAAVACARSRLPEGCGAAICCRECVIRSTVDAVCRSGAAVAPTPAYLDGAEGRVALWVSARPRGELVEVRVEPRDASAA